VWNASLERMEKRAVSFVPGLFKIFDEILVNAADNKRRDDTMKYIKVTINPELGEISVENDGNGIPVEVHETEGVYIPQMVFGELLTGDNYDDSEDRVVGGRNGYGAKLANIFSTSFTVETADSSSGKQYKQTWTDNMDHVGKPAIKKVRRGWEDSVCFLSC
jgi:DNA topoisomerase-2